MRDRVLSARHVRNQADSALHDAALNARGAGFTWSEVAADLGMVTSDDGDTPRAVRAFEWVVSDHATDQVYWTCHECGNTVADSGPYDANPANCEHGHRWGCARVVDDLKRYREELVEAGLVGSGERSERSGHRGGVGSVRLSFGGVFIEYVNGFAGLGWRCGRARPARCGVRWSCRVVLAEVVSVAPREVGA